MNSLSIGLSLLVMVVGAVVYAVSDGKPAQVGLAAFNSGLTAFLLQVAGEVSLHMR